MKENIENAPPGAIPVFLACDRKYLPYATALCLSILKHTRHRILFHVLHDGSLCEKDRARTRALLEKYGKQELIFTQMDGRAEFRTWTKRFPPIVYYRLLIPFRFQQYDRCLYLDSDMLVNSDLSELYETDLHGHLFGAAPDYDWMTSYRKNVKLFGKYANTGLREYCEKIQLKNPERYFNSGVLLMDLKAIRARGLALLEETCAHAGEDFLLPDQDLINCCLAKEIFPLKDEWNYPLRKTAMPEGRIYHYLSKPWHNSSVDADRAFYWNALKETPYFYQVRAEMLLYEIEASINSNWRYEKDNAISAAGRLAAAFFIQLAKRFLA